MIHAGLFLFSFSLAARSLSNVNEDVPVDQAVELRLLRFGVIRGRIVDGDTGEPVRVFRIRIAGGRGYLDYARTRPGERFDSTDGSFLLEKLDQEPHDLWSSSG